MNITLKSALAVTAMVVSAQAGAEVIFYERDNFEGRSFTTQRPVRGIL